MSDSGIWIGKNTLVILHGELDRKPLDFWVSNELRCFKRSFKDPHYRENTKDRNDCKQNIAYKFEEKFIEFVLVDVHGKSPILLLKPFLVEFSLS